VKRQPFGRHDQCLWVRCLRTLHKIDVEKNALMPRPRQWLNTNSVEFKRPQKMSS
jgi:hypothetical protein